MGKEYQTKSYTINNDKEMDKLVLFVNQIDKNMQSNGKAVNITWTTDVSKIRTLAQNSLLACYINEIKETFGGSISEIRVNLKRDFGLAILMEQYNEAKEKAVKRLKDGERLNYSMISQAGREAGDTHVLLKTIHYDIQPLNIQNKILKPLPCTSIMTTKWFLKYLEAIEQEYSQHGLVLESINETKRREAFG